MPSTTLRQPWIDNLRTLVIFLVVIQHACVTYSHVGSWYVMSTVLPSALQKLIFIEWEGHMQSFFMGLLFLVSGYFAIQSLQRHGPGAFIRERLLRLGIPTLLYMLIVHPFIVLGLNPWGGQPTPPLAFFGNYLTSGKFLASTGPLWFAFALLIFCLMLAGWHALRPLGYIDTKTKDSITGARLIIFGAGLTLSTFLVRISQPIGTSLINFQLCYFAQYILAFATGVEAARQGWLTSLARSVAARRAGQLAIILGPIALLILLTTGDPLINDTAYRLEGGLHIESLALADWEQFTGLGIALGLLSWFYSRWDMQSTVLSWLSNRSFAVYFIHTPVLVAVTMTLRPLESAFNPFLLAALLAASGLVGSYLLADIIKRIPGLRSIL